MSNTLLPCPFCGGEADIFEASEDSFCALCTGCGVETPYQISAEEAIAAWSRRAQPENETLTLEDLRKMDGEPVYCVDGAGNECWCVVNEENDDCIDNEAGAWVFSFYAMPGDDGLYGLNKQLGWLAYRHKPERSEG